MDWNMTVAPGVHDTRSPFDPRNEVCCDAHEEDAFAHDKGPCSSLSDGAFILLAAANEADPAPIMEKDEILNKHHNQDNEHTQFLAFQGHPCP